MKDRISRKVALSATAAFVPIKPVLREEALASTVASSYSCCLTLGGLAMRVRQAAVGLFLAMLTGGAVAQKDKELPMYVLQAQTIAVMIDPDAGVSLKDPYANQTAQRDVETALVNWGRFRVVIGSEQADLVVVIAKGSGKLAAETLPDRRQNSRPGSVTPSQDGIGIGVQHGTQPPLREGGSTNGTQNGERDPRPQAVLGQVDDTFSVYEGKLGEPVMDSPPVWRWVHKNGLHSHDVPAVDEFRKAIAKAEKKIAQQSSNPSKPSKKP
jgi:hypothetical protein